MNKEQFIELQTNVEIVREVIKKLTEGKISQPDLYQLGILLIRTNKFLTETMWREVMRKGDDGQYIHKIDEELNVG